jgi:protein-disulfide isomerase
MMRTLAAAVALLVLPGWRAGQADPLAARTKGRPEAPVTVYEMSDFQCPYCRAFALTTLPVLEREYVTTGKVRFVYINLPLASLHRNAVAAAEAALCAASQRRFWPMHDLLFRHQDEWATLADPRPSLLALGDSAGLDHAPFAACVSTGTTAAAVRSDAELAQRSGAVSTPSFYIEGGLLQGAAPVEVFRLVLDSIYRSKTVGPPR